MAPYFPAPHRHHSEAGYMLVAVMFMLFVLAISLSIAAPIVARSIQLDRERETIERGKQYQRAIQLYYRRFHAYPPTIDALVETNNIRFLRKRYVDPMTRKDDWRTILFGQNKAPTAMGFFGQPLNGVGSTGASTLAGIGPSGGNGIGGSQIGGAGSPVSSQAGTFGGSSIFASSTPPGGSDAPGFAPGTTPGSAPGTTPGSASGTTPNPNAQSFGGAGIIGVSSASGAPSIMVYKKKTRYDEWEFTYDPLSDVTLSRNNAVVNQPSAGSLVGTGTGPNGTGPIIAPGSNPQGTNPPPQQ